MGRNYYLYIALAFTALITLGSLMSIKDVSGAVPFKLSDKVVHFGAYFVLALSWLLTFRNKYKTSKQFIIIAFIVFLYGILIEGCQMLFTSERQADVYDMLANLGGILGALLFFRLIIKKNK